MINSWEKIFMLKCEICGKSVKSVMSLSRHITQSHKYKSKQYYDEFISHGIPECRVCGSKEVSFIGLGAGYNPTCSHVCGGIFHRDKLRADAVRYDEFTMKVATNQKKIWKDRGVDGSDLQIRKKISNTLITNNSLLSDDECKNKFGWMNRLSDDELAIWKTQRMLHSGAHAWWKTASDEEKAIIYKKRTASLMGITLEEYCAVERDPIQEYYTLVGMFTAISYREHKNQIDPYNLRSNEFHLDHKYSILRGFYDGIPPEVIGSPANLEMLPASQNVRKSAKCSITKEQLLEDYYAQI